MRINTQYYHRVLQTLCTHITKKHPDIHDNWVLHQDNVQPRTGIPRTEWNPSHAPTSIKPGFGSLWLLVVPITEKVSARSVFQIHAASRHGYAEVLHFVILIQICEDDPSKVDRAHAGISGKPRTLLRKIVYPTLREWWQRKHVRIKFYSFSFFHVFPFLTDQRNCFYKINCI